MACLRTPRGDDGAMNASQSPWLSYVLPAFVVALALALRWRRIARERPLKVERLWIVPLLYCGLAGFTFWRFPPQGLVWLWCALGLGAGAAIGWWRGKMMRIAVDPDTHALSQKGSPAAMLLILGLIVVRSAARNADALGIPGIHVDVMSMTDVLIAFALGLLTAQRLEMFLRARRLLGEARAK
jgi:hypothetical protein